MNIRNAAQAWEQLQNMAASFFDSSRLIETACLKFDDVDEFRVGELRRSYLDRIKEQSIKGFLSGASAEKDVHCRVDLLGKGSNFGNDDVSATTTPTKILAASASLVRNSSAFSSTSSTIGTRGQGDVHSSLRGDENRRFVRDLLTQLQETGSAVPDGKHPMGSSSLRQTRPASLDVCSKIHELIDRLAEAETECRDAQLQLNATCKEITKANEANRSLKGRLGAVYTELDKKNECLDRMIAKCQVLTEKVAAQEEVQHHRCTIPPYLTPCVLYHQGDLQTEAYDVLQGRRNANQQQCVFRRIVHVTRECCADQVMRHRRLQG